MSLSKTNRVLEQALRKTGQKPGFSITSKEAVPKTEVLEQPRINKNCIYGGIVWTSKRWKKLP
jgi:hypothetical protein